MAGRASLASDAVEQYLPGAYVSLVLSVVRRLGVTSQSLLAPLGLSEGDFEAPDARIPFATACEILRRARAITTPGIGILIGLATRANSYGFLSFASMSAASLGESIELMIRYTPMLTTSFRFRLARAGDIAALVVDVNEDGGDVRDVLLFSLLVGLRGVGCALTGREPWRPIDVAFPEPPYYRSYADVLPEFRFDQPDCQILLRESDLELPLLTPSRAALRLAVEQCEARLKMVGPGASVGERVRGLVCADGSMRSFSEVAHHLCMSPRTLRRRLSESGITFSRCVEQARRDTAVLLLRSDEASIDEVAERLGYSTVSNFVRAFRRWTGLTPSAFRRRVDRSLVMDPPFRR